MVSIMAIEVDADKIVCNKCGTGYGRRRGNFYKTYGELYKGVGYLPYCSKCVDGLYAKYLAQSNDSKAAVRQVCRKLDLYWSDTIFDSVSKKSSVRSLMAQYIARINNTACTGKSYDDTLLDNGNLWNFDFSKDIDKEVEDTEPVIISPAQTDEKEIEIPQEVVDFWGSGYSPEMYEQLEQRRKYYAEKFPDAFSGDNSSDIGSDVLMRQLCNLEVSISKDVAAGKSIDKSVNSLNTLIGSLNLKPAQKKTTEPDSAFTNTPLGVWLYKYENKRPLPEIDSSLRDVNHIKKYVFTWMGHLCKMLGIKNGYTKLYEEEINRLRVEKPEYNDDDEETLLSEVYSEESEENEHSE